jgi:hypothetical protein
MAPPWPYAAWELMAGLAFMIRRAQRAFRLGSQRVLEGYQVRIATPLR